MNRKKIGKLVYILKKSELKKGINKFDIYLNMTLKLNSFSHFLPTAIKIAKPEHITPEFREELHEQEIELQTQEKELKTEKSLLEQEEKKLSTLMRKVDEDEKELKKLEDEVHNEFNKLEEDVHRVEEKVDEVLKQN